MARPELSAGARAFEPRRGLAWGQLLLGWVCAQGLLTLIPIAPPGWGTPFLLVTGGGFAAWALLGLSRALSARPALVIGADGIRAGAREIPWAEVASWQALPSEKRIAIRLVRGARPPSPAERAAALLQGSGSLSFDARLIDASLTDIVRAFRDIRPDLESPE